MDSCNVFLVLEEHCPPYHDPSQKFWPPWSQQEHNSTCEQNYVAMVFCKGGVLYQSGCSRIPVVLKLDRNYDCIYDSVCNTPLLVIGFFLYVGVLAAIFPTTRKHRYQVFMMTTGTDSLMCSPRQGGDTNKDRRPNRKPILYRVLVYAIHGERLSNPLTTDV